MCDVCVVCMCGVVCMCVGCMYGMYMWYDVCVHVGGLYVWIWCAGGWVCTRACVSYIYGPAAARGEDMQHRRIFLHLEAQVTEAGS